MVGGLPNKSIWNIDYEDLVFGEVIGKGNFGLVFKGNYLGVEVAIKQIPSYDDPDYCKYTEREVKALRYIRHPYIVHFFGACHHSSGFYLITEYIQDQDLRRFIKASAESQRPPKWQIRLTISLSIAKTFLFLHSKNILHRDLKSKNVLLDFTKSRNVSTKLCDFGFTRIGSQYSSGEDSSSSEEEDDNNNNNNNSTEQPPYKYNGNGKPAKYRLRRMSICGTISFMAPEVLLQQKYDWSVDVYSFGIILAELITLKRPGKDFWVRNQLNNFDIIESELAILSPLDTPPELYDLCMKCCNYQSSARPKFSDIINILENILLKFTNNNITKSLSNLDLNYLNFNNNNGNSNNNSNNNSSIGVWREKKRQSINEIFHNKFSLRTSFNSHNNNNNSHNEREGLIKLKDQSSLNNFSNNQNIWIIYKDNDRIEMTIGKVSKISKNTIHIITNDINLINGNEVLNLKPYLKEFPHIKEQMEDDEQEKQQQQQQKEISINNEILIGLIKSWAIRKKYHEFKSNWDQGQIDLRNQWISLTSQFIQSELTYKKQLDLLVKSYLDPLKSRFRMNKPLIGIREINCIFSNIELISEMNSEFIKILQPIQSAVFYSGDVVSISQFIIRSISQIKNIYGTYAFNFKYAMNILVWCKLNPDFSGFLEKVKSSFKGYEEYDLTSLLSLPINKIQKYLYLFEKIIQMTPSQHFDHVNLSNAFSLVKETSNSIQTQLEMSLEYSHIMSIETMLSNNHKSLMKEGRWFVRQGLFEDISKKQQYFIFLLSDICLLTKPVKSKTSNENSSSNKKFYYSIRNQIQLDENISMKLNPDNNNSLILTIGSGNKIYKLQPVSENPIDEVGDWINDFERTIILLYRNNISDHSKSLEDIYNTNNNNNPLSLSNNNLETPTKGIIKRFRQSISSGSGNSPDRRASLLNLSLQKSESNGNNNSGSSSNNNNNISLKSSVSLANFNLSTPTQPTTTTTTTTMNSTPNNIDKKGKLKSITNKLKRLSVSFSASPINEGKRKELSKE